MRANSLTNLGVALDYNVVSDYDKVLVVAGLASEIEELAPHANEIANLVANLPDVLTVQEASELVNNLTVKVNTLPAGSVATSELVGTEIRLGIPAGTQGVQGLQGPKGDKGDKGDIGLPGAQGPIGLTGPQGPRGLRGNDGVDGVGVEITSILNNPDKSLTINFSDGTQHTTDPLKGQDGTSIIVTNVVNNANGTMQINFSDGTSHTTADLTGPRGFKGDTGDHVHHISYQRSKDALGNEVGPVGPGSPGYDDTYAIWTSQEELPETYIGEFAVHNGLNTLTVTEQLKFDSIEFGATADQAAVDVPFDNSGAGFVADNVQTALVELEITKEDKSNKGMPNGYAGLDANGIVPSTQLPSYVDDVLEYATYADLPVTGEEGKIYVVIADETSGNDTSSYRWTGTVYAMVSNTLTAADIKELYESNANTNEFTDDEKTKLTNTEVTSQLNDRDTANRDRTNHTGTQDLDTITETADKKIMTANERTKLGAIEDGATADQTAEEIEALYEGLSDTNKYTDAEKAKVADLSGVNTGDQTDITGNAGTVTNGVYTTDIGTTVQAYNADIVIDSNYIAYTQTEKDKVANIPDNTDLVLGTTTFTRFDKILGSMDIIDMDYLNGDLVTVRYTGDNDTNVFYRDVLEYADGDLTTVKHYYNTASLVTESGLTTLVYDIDKNLISSSYTEV